MAEYGMRTVCAAGGLNWNFFSTSTVLEYVCKVRHSLIWDRLSVMRSPSATAQTDQQLRVGKTILVRHSFAVPGLTQLVATAIQITLAGRTLKALSVYISPSRPLICADTNAYFGFWLPVLLVGNTNAKDVDCN
jgi:hypothetical protein